MRKLTIGTLLVLGMLIPGARAVSALQEHPAPTTRYVVKAGDTLWDIAADLQPDGDRRAIVDAVMELNNLSSPALLPGQMLSLPTP